MFHFIYSLILSTAIAQTTPASSAVALFEVVDTLAINRISMIADRCTPRPTGPFGVGVLFDRRSDTDKVQCVEGEIAKFVPNSPIFSSLKDICTSAIGGHDVLSKGGYWTNPNKTKLRCYLFGLDHLKTKGVGTNLNYDTAMAEWLDKTCSGAEDIPGFTSSCLRSVVPKYLYPHLTETRKREWEMVNERFAIPF
ncbi:MAG: hypothetical protein ABL958_15830, partial [Bdellovibrionia bacterium]